MVKEISFRGCIDSWDPGVWNIPSSPSAKNWNRWLLALRALWGGKITTVKLPVKRATERFTYYCIRDFQDYRWNFSKPISGPPPSPFSLKGVSLYPEFQYLSRNPIKSNKSRGPIKIIASLTGWQYLSRWPVGVLLEPYLPGQTSPQQPSSHEDPAAVLSSTVKAGQAAAGSFGGIYENCDILGTFDRSHTSTFWCNILFPPVSQEIWSKLMGWKYMVKERWQHLKSLIA